MRPILFALLGLSLPLAADDTAWPPVTQEAKPWTRWWWLGSGVDAANLTKQLEAFSKAGIGGVEICPIYGAKGYEARDLRFLSEPWTTAYAHTAKEASRLGMGVDLTTGTGWPFGGPWVKQEDASASFADGVVKHGIQKVKRAAPGGAGWVLDPFSTKAIGNYLKEFDAALDRADVPEPRAHFHDSFEYYGANWTDDLYPRFQELRGYDLRTQLPALNGEGDAEIVKRVRADYRQTMSDLHREYLAHWHDWANKRGSVTRNQAHGSPGNLLDHYAVADIPETEIFRHVDEAQIPMLQFASSAAHVSGKKLVSAETFTWLDEHFRVTPTKLKEAADFVWLGGVNHILFHGIPYSPEEAGWPGWLFYASTHMGPNGGLWRDLPVFNAYIARCQAMLQAGKPDAEVLIYFPMHDLWQDGAKGLPLFTVHNQDKWLHPGSLYRAAMNCWEKGVPCDFISDRLLADAKVVGEEIKLGESSYKVLVVPETRYMPLTTAMRLFELAGGGGRIVFLGATPAGTPGFFNHENGSQGVASLFRPIPEMSLTKVEKGTFLRQADLAKLPEGISGEPMAAQKLRFVRRRHEDGWAYFIVNRSGAAFDSKVTFATPMKSAVLFDPMRGNSGVVAIDEGIRLVLAPGESRILRTYRDKDAQGQAWREVEHGGAAVTLEGTWKVSFLEGGPELPAAFEAGTLESWTKLDGVPYRDFSGTALYRLEFDWQGKPPALLDLGEIRHTARVRLNGKDAGTCWFPPHRLAVELKSGANMLEVEVSNPAANRIASLDRKKAPWKAFHEINFVNIDYKPFDAAGWEPMESGLLGPVRVIPIQ